MPTSTWSASSATVSAVVTCRARGGRRDRRLAAGRAALRFAARRRSTRLLPARAREPPHRPSLAGPASHPRGATGGHRAARSTEPASRAWCCTAGSASRHGSCSAPSVAPPGAVHRGHGDRDRISSAGFWTRGYPAGWLGAGRPQQARWARGIPRGLAGRGDTPQAAGLTASDARPYHRQPRGAYAWTPRS